MSKATTTGGSGDRVETPKRKSKKNTTDDNRTTKTAELAKFRDDDVISLVSLEDIDSELGSCSPSTKTLISDLKYATEANISEFGLFQVEVRRRFDTIDAYFKTTNRSKLQPEKSAKVSNKAAAAAKQTENNLQEQLTRQLVQNANLNTEIITQKKENALQHTEIRHLKSELQTRRDRCSELKLRLEQFKSRVQELTSQLQDQRSNDYGSVRNGNGYVSSGAPRQNTSYFTTRARSTFEPRGHRGSHMRDMSDERGHVRQEYATQHRSTSQKRRSSRSPLRLGNDKRRRQRQNEELVLLRPAESKTVTPSNNEDKARRTGK